MRKVLIFPTRFKDFGLSSPLLMCLSFSFRVQNMQKDVGFIHISDALTEAMLDHPRERQNPKTSATLHENASPQKETNATLHGNAFRLLMGPQSGPPQIAQSIYFKLFGTFVRPNGKI